MKRKYKPNLRPCKKYTLVKKRGDDIVVIDGPFRNEDEVLNMEGASKYYVCEINLDGSQTLTWKWDDADAQWVSLKTIKSMYGIWVRHDGERCMSHGPTDDPQRVAGYHGK